MKRTKKTQVGAKTVRKATPERKAMAIALLASGCTRTAVAEQLGVSRQCVGDWLRDPEFAAELDAFIAQLREDATRGLKALVGKAIMRLEIEMETAKFSSDRIAAAKTILDRNAGFTVPTKVEHSGEVKGLAQVSDAKLLEMAREAMMVLGKDEKGGGDDGGNGGGGGSNQAAA